jgi:hypothetical protein
MLSKKVADQFVQTPAGAGVKRIYDIVSDGRNGLTDFIRHGKIDWIRVRHEEVAAGAEAHLTRNSPFVRVVVDRTEVAMPPLRHAGNGFTLMIKTVTSEYLAKAILWR